MFPKAKNQSGFNLIEVIIVSAVLVIFFVGLITMVTYLLKLTANSRVKLSAMALTQERVEYIRSLSYDAVGTVGGIPAGLIPQKRENTLNGYTFLERVLVQYVDDPADGTGSSDSNGIVADYKQVKVEYSWNVTGATTTISTITNIVPRSIETTAGGGTIRVNVFDAKVAALSGAEVRVFNDTMIPPIDVTRLTDATGVALFAGAPTGSDYQITVTKPGYSTDQTHSAGVDNPNPTTLPISVLEADVSTMNFQIDRVSPLSLLAYSNIDSQSSKETFSDASSVVAATSTTVSGGAVSLAGGVGSYEVEGTADVLFAPPAPFARFEAISLVRTLPDNTALRVQFLIGSTTDLVPEADLPGNAAGFSSRLIDMRSLSAIDYPSLTLRATLLSSDATVTPLLDELVWFYRVSETPLSGAGFTLRGSKVIGTGASMEPIYKYALSANTTPGGAYTFGDREWDTYTLAFNAFSLKSICPSHPFSLMPGIPLTVEAQAGVAEEANLRVQVVDMTGLPIPDATVTLTRAGYNTSLTTGACGQVFYGSGLITESDYRLTVAAKNFVTNSIDPFSINKTTVATVTLIE